MGYRTHPDHPPSLTLSLTPLQMGYHTLITDMDLVYMKNPFEHLHRYE